MIAVAAGRLDKFVLLCVIIFVINLHQSEHVMAKTTDQKEENLRELRRVRKRVHNPIVKLHSIPSTSKAKGGGKRNKANKRDKKSKKESAEPSPSPTDAPFITPEDESCVARDNDVEEGFSWVDAVVQNQMNREKVEQVTYDIDYLLIGEQITTVMDADTISNFKEAILKLLQETFDAACPFGQMTYTSVELVSQAIQSDRRELGQVGRQLQTGANYIKTSTSSYGPPPSPCMECISSDALDRNRRHLFVMDPSEIGHKRKMQDSDILEFLLDTGDLYFNDVTEVDVDVVEEGEGVYTISDVTAQPSTVPTNSNVPQ